MDEIPGQPAAIFTRSSEATWLRARGFKPVPAHHEVPEVWNPPDGTAGITGQQAFDRVGAHWDTGRAALLAKPFYKTSEFWMTGASTCLGLGAAATGLMASGEFLPERLSNILVPAGVSLAALSTGGYRLARYIAKRIDPQAAVEEPPKQLP